ncbi:MAG TPA: DEAD/DEAH box helicase family protein [Solirubrobacteraceae bacterium]|nr:DEAD/DEAH box helicase family protein [Solirubrobacteraceae bacterium]
MVDESQADFLRIGEAAGYVGVTPQTLRRWDAEGRLVPVRQPGNGYRYYARRDLEPFRLEYQRAEGANPGLLFQTANADIEANQLLREPQREAHRSVREHFADSKTPAILQIPVGCGKTGIMATLPFGIASGRALVITPNLTIRKGVADALDIASRECFWAKMRVLADFTDGPYFAVLDSRDANLHDCTESHFVVTNIQQLASSADRWLPQFPPNFFDLILVDEGHHAAASSWQKVFRRFPEAKVVSLTATPFRSDEQPLEGEVIYRYPFARAMMNGFIKQIHSRNVAPSELTFTFGDDTQRHTLEEVLQLRDEQWFRRGVALSPECNRHIAEASIQRCDALRAETGIQHQIIAAACSVDHARQVRAIYEQCGYRAAEIHSGMSEDEKEAVLDRLRVNKIDCIVQVQMLGEGFDHPRLSVAAVFRPFRSLAPYIQFVGRVMRVVRQGAPEHPDNQGFVVSHIGLNNDARWEEFRELDLDDQSLIHDWLTAEPVEGEPERGEGEPRRFDLGALVDNELVSHFVDRTFLDPEDDRVLDELLGRAIAPGVTVGDVVDREVLRQRLRQRVAAMSETPTLVPVTPQRRRQTARKRLSERTGSVVARVLTELDLARAGRDVARVMGGRPAANVQVITRLLNEEINKGLGIGSGARSTLTSEQTELALERLDEFGDAVRAQLSDVLSS